jgi:hypothetical protein
MADDNGVKNEASAASDDNSKGTQAISPAPALTTETKRPKLVSKPTTAVSKTAIRTQTFPDGSRTTYADTGFQPLTGHESNRRYQNEGTSSEIGDVGSILSVAPTIEGNGDVESLLSEVLNSSRSPAWQLLQGGTEQYEFPFEMPDHSILEEHFAVEFDAIHLEEEVRAMESWKSRLKHFLIMSSAGKPIYTRHGNEELISPYIGVIHTLISFYASTFDKGDTLRFFTSDSTNFAILIQGPVYLVAISKLQESESQLRAQLDALYMQILSTLTLPTLEHLFLNRPSTDLRRVLQGTEPLLNGLVDTFTRGSVPSLLSALECLKLRKSQRAVINNAFLKHRNPSLLYGLIVAKGRLVSVVRPKKHSLHPSDLQLIFNMLFEADGIRAAGGENWVPLCLPGFNKTGYLYMYVSFLSQPSPTSEEQSSTQSNSGEDDTSIALLLISANKDSFPSQQDTRNAILSTLTSTKSISLIHNALPISRVPISIITPNLPIQHFLYKSRLHVQYIQASHEPYFTTLFARRKLHSLYAELHEAIHSRSTGGAPSTGGIGAAISSSANSGRKMLHVINAEHVALALVTQTYELFVVAKQRTNKRVLAKAAQLILAAIKREEERYFIIGGAVF